MSYEQKLELTPEKRVRLLALRELWNSLDAAQWAVVVEIAALVGDDRPADYRDTSDYLDFLFEQSVEEFWDGVQEMRKREWGKYAAMTDWVDEKSRPHTA